MLKIHSEIFSIYSSLVQILITQSFQYFCVFKMATCVNKQQFSPLLNNKIFVRKLKTVQANDAQVLFEFK